MNKDVLDMAEISPDKVVVKDISGGIPVEVRDLGKCLEGCNALVGDQKIRFSSAKEIAHVIVAIEDKSRAIAIRQKAILGGKTRIMSDDFDAEKKIADLDSLNDEIVYLNCGPINGEDLEKAAPTIWPPALGVLLRAKLVI
jgi:hypothetical protein